MALLHHSKEGNDKPAIFPDEPNTTHEKSSFSKKAKLAAGAAVVVVASAASGALLFGGDDKPTGGPKVEASGAQPTPTPEVIPNKTYGNIWLGNIIPGERYLTAVRSGGEYTNGEEIRVPYLRSTNNPEKFAESAMALLSCFVTTGEQKCLDAFSTNEYVQRDLKNEYFNEGRHFSRITRGDEQLVFFDDPQNPAKFSHQERDDGKIVIELASGNLYFGRVANPIIASQGGSSWQSEQSREYGRQYTVTELYFRTDVTEAGDPTIVGFRWFIRPN